MIDVAVTAAWLLIGWLNARWFAHLLGEVEDGFDFAFTLFLIAFGPVGLGGTVLIALLEGELRLPGSDRVDWGSVTRRVLALKD